MSMKCIVRVVEAKGLRAADLNGKSDPYVKIGIRGSAQPEQRTRTLYKTLSPIWNEEFTLQNVRPTDTLELRIWDSDVASRDDYLGQVDIPLGQYVNSPRDEWKPILEKKRGLSKLSDKLTGMQSLRGGSGEIHLSIWVGTGMPSQQAAAPAIQSNMYAAPQQQQYPNPGYPAPQPQQQQYPTPSYSAPQQQQQHPGQYPQNTYGNQNVPGIISYPQQNASSTHSQGYAPQNTQSYPQSQQSYPQPQQAYPQPQQAYPQPTTSSYPATSGYSAPQQQQQYPGQYPQNTYGNQSVPGLLSFNNGAAPAAGGAYPSRDPTEAKQFPNAWGPGPAPPSYMSEPRPYGVL